MNYEKEAYLIITDGRDVIHEVQNNTGNVTATSHPFLLMCDTKKEATDLFYSSWSEDEERIVTSVQNEIKWGTGYTSFAEIQGICNAVMSIADWLIIKPIKHPNRDEWAGVMQEAALNALPNSDIKTTILGNLTSPSVLTRTEMESDGWF